MNIVACIKRVPDTETQAKVASDGKGMDATGVQYMCSFYDEIAVEEAVRTKESLGGEVTVVTLGPAEVKKEILDALSKGADKAILLKDDGWAQRDCLATAKILAAKIRELGPDVVFCGRLATDRDNAAVGPMLATLLGWACVTDVIGLELGADGEGTARRESEAGIETFSFSLPAVVTCQKDLNEPRFSNLKGIMAAKKKPLEEASFEDVASQAEVTGVEQPPTRPPGRIIGEGAAAVPALIEALHTEAKVL